MTSFQSSSRNELNLSSEKKQVQENKSASKSRGRRMDKDKSKNEQLIFHSSMRNLEQRSRSKNLRNPRAKKQKVRKI